MDRQWCSDCNPTRKWHLEAGIEWLRGTVDGLGENRYVERLYRAAQAEGGAPVNWAWHCPADGTATAPDGLTRAIIRNG